jgi:diguanylate cyclase (GGDEF)-like protein
MKTKMTILVVEDDKDLNHLMQKTLKREGFCVESVKNGADAITRLTGDRNTIMLLDYILPDMTAYDVVEALSGKEFSVPFVIITGHGDEKIAVEMMKNGARDYIVKNPDFIDVLPHVIKRVVNDLKIEKELADAERAVAESQKELSILYEVSSAISQTINLNELFKIIFDTITGIDILNIEKKGGIFFIEDDRLKLVSHMGFSDSLVDHHKNLRVGDCLCGLAAKNKEVIITSKCTTDKRHTIAYPGMTEHGHIIIPLNARGMVKGVLCLYLSPDVRVDESKMKMLDALGNQIGVAIDNARLYEETKKFSLHDSLTGLANRRMMHIVFDRSINRAKRYKEPFSVIMLDIDYFKKYNDTHGHFAGDRLLVELAGLIVHETREIDLVVRYGGEEFIVLLPETDLDKACEVAERMRETIEKKCATTISLGVSSYNMNKQTKDELIKDVDGALYNAKKRGRNRVEVKQNKKIKRKS